MNIGIKRIISIFFLWCFSILNLAWGSELTTPEGMIEKFKLGTFSNILDLPVVHATHVFPEEGIMKPGKCSAKNISKNGLNIQKGEILTGPMSWRPTLHWAIGGLAGDISENTLSDRPYAIVTTLKNLLPQLIGINIEDTFILGEFKIPTGSFFISQKGRVDVATKAWIKNSNIEFMEFKDPETLTQKVNSLIKEKFIDTDTRIGNLLKSNRKSKKFLSQSLSKFAKMIPCVDFGPHSRHPTLIIEKLIPYSCIAAYGAYPDETIKDISAQSLPLRKKVCDYYKEKLKERKLDTTFDTCSRELIRLTLDFTTDTNRTPEQKYKDYISENNTSKDTEDHKIHFSQFYIKGMYLSDIKFQTGIEGKREVKINGKIVANESQIASNIKEWYPS